MTYVILVALSLALFFGFVMLTWYEMHHTRRFFGKHRNRLDTYIDHIVFIFVHVDLGSFAREETQRLTRQGGHAVAQMSLTGVRATERSLTHLVRRLRTHHAIEETPRESTRPFVKSLSEFKTTLKENAPDIDPF